MQVFRKAHASETTADNQIRRRRLLLRLTQEQVARRVGVTLNAYQKWEKGTIPRGDHLIRLAQAMACRPEELL